MLIILTPSKTMDFTTPAPAFVRPTTPAFVKQANAIVDTVRAYDHAKLQQLMSISEPLVNNVHTLFTQWGEQGKKSALWAYKGDVYKGMLADTMPQAAALWAQDHLVIMSGLYGALRPLDAMCAYRLEMKTKLHVGKHKNLYEFWGETVAQYAEARANGLIVNLCSDEYAQIITKRTTPQTAIVTPTFFDTKPTGKIGQVPIYSKMMRGVMARWMIDERIENPDDLQQFRAHGYSYCESLSQPNAPAFFRQKMTPLRFD